MEDLGTFSDPQVQRCPYPFIKTLHEKAPVYKDPVTGFYVVTSYSDVVFVNENPQMFSSKTTIINKENDESFGGTEVARRYAEKGYIRADTLVTNDPPSHSSFRGALDKIFTPTFVKGLEPYITELVNQLIDEFIESGEADLQNDFCIRLPMYVIVDQLGLPREKWRIFKAWSDATVDLIDPTISMERRLELVDLHIEMQQYLMARAEEYRSSPADTLLSKLAHSKIDGRDWTPEEFVSTAEIVFIAGNETTTTSIAHAVDILIRQPHLQAELVGQPDKIRSFVEESLRLHAPSPHVYRRVMTDTRLGGIDLPAGSIIMIDYLAANRDEAKYAHAGEVDVSRPGLRKHLSFGYGIHSCLGNILARAEIRIALECLLARLHNVKFAPGRPEPRLAAHFHLHKLENLNVAFDPSTRLKRAT